MSMEADRKLLHAIEAAARGAGDIMLGATDIFKETSEKGSFKNLVTKYDQQVQQFLETELLKLLPGAHFLGEENGETVYRDSYDSGDLFIIDPIDGTSNFICGYRPSVTSIGLVRDGRPFMGVIYNPYSDELFSAISGCGACCNGKPIHSSARPLSQSLVAMGTSPYYSDEVIRGSFDLGYSFMNRCIDIRRSGSAAWDLCMVAKGVVGLYFERVLQVWDYAAGALIAKEAGATVTDMEGRPLSYRGAASIAAASEGVAREEYLPW